MVMFLGLMQVSYCAGEAAKEAAKKAKKDTAAGAERPKVSLTKSL